MGGTILQDYIKERCQNVGSYIVDTKCTVRQAAKKFSVSKSSIHKDVVERLPKVNNNLYQQVRIILEINKAQRHIRGGQATLLKYQNQRLKAANC